MKMCTKWLFKVLGDCTWARIKEDSNYCFCYQKKKKKNHWKKERAHSGGEFRGPANVVSCPLSQPYWRRELWSHREGFRRKDKPAVGFVCVTVQVVGSTVVNTTLISILYEVRVEMAPSVWRRQRWLARTKGRSWGSHPPDQENAVGGKLCLWMKKSLCWVPEDYHICPMVHAHTHRSICISILSSHDYKPALKISISTDETSLTKELLPPHTPTQWQCLWTVWN